MCSLSISLLNSHDMQWVHVLRVIYRSVPNSNIATVEALFEQICQESIQITQMLLCAMEDCTIQIGTMVIQNTYKKRSLLSLTSGSIYLYDDLPVVSHYDVRLVLILSRSIVTSNRLYNTTQNTTSSSNTNSSSSSSYLSINHQNEIPWPAATMSGINSQPIPEQNLQCNTVFDSQLSTRCIFMLLLTCTALEIIEQIRFGEYKTGNMNVIFQNMIKYSILQENNENNTINKERMQYNCAWIYDERAKEIIKISILLSRYSNIANICILQLQTWLKDHSLLKLSIKKNSFFLLPTALEDCVLVAYRCRENMRGAIVSFLLNGVVTCTATSGSSTVVHASSNVVGSSSGNSSTNTTNYNSNTNSNITQLDSNRLSEKKIPEELSAVTTLLQQCFFRICAIQEYINTSILTRIQQKFTILTSTISIQYVLQKFIVSLLLLCKHAENNVFSLVLNYLQKSIQHKNNIIQCSASYLLISLLYSVPVLQQEEIVRTICFGFSRTSTCCREVYCRSLQYLLPTTTATGSTTINTDAGGSSSTSSADPSDSAYDSNMHHSEPVELQERTLIYRRDSLQRKLSEQFTPPSNTSIINSATTSASASNKAVDEEEEYVFNPHFALKPITSGTIILEDIQDSLFLLWVLALKINADQALYDISLLIKWISHPEGEQLDSEENYGNIHMIAYCI